MRNSNNIIYYVLGVLAIVFMVYRGQPFSLSPLTIIIIGINILIFILVKIKLLSIDKLGSSYYTVFEKHGFHRIVTAMFTHEEFWHILCNMISIYNIMPFIERTTSFSTAIIVYLATGIVGGFISCALHKKDFFTLSIGASGAICGTFGFMIIWMIKTGLFMTNIRSIIITLVLLAMMTFSSKIDSKCHFSCLACGLVAGIIYILICP